MTEKNKLDSFEELGRALLRKQCPCVDLVEKIAFEISHKYLLPMKGYVKEKQMPEKDANTLMMNLTKLIFYIGRDFIAVEYMDEILPKDTKELLGEDNLLVQAFDYSDEELSVQQFICKVLGLKLSDYNPTISLAPESQDIADLFLPTNDAVNKLAELGYNFTAEESFTGLNSGFIDFCKGRFHRLINCRFHYVENDNLKTRIAKWIDFYPCKCEEEDIDGDRYLQSFQCYLPKYDELWKKDLFYKLPIPVEGKYSKLPIINRFIEVFGDRDNKETDITSFLAEKGNSFILLMTFSGITLKSQLLCIWQDDEKRKDLKPDFFIVKANGTADIIEFKLPSLKNKAIVGTENRETFSAELSSYIAQLSVYAEYFDDSANRKWFEKKYGFTVYKPRKYLVVGRRSDFSSDEWQKIKARYSDVEIYTYDDIVDTVVSFLYCV